MEEGSGIWEGLAGDFERLRREEHIPRGRNVSRLRDSKAQSCKEESGVDKNSGREREKESHGQQCMSLKVKYLGHRWRVRRKKCEISHWQFWHRRDLKTWRRPAENSWQCFRTRVFISSNSVCCSLLGLSYCLGCFSCFCEKIPGDSTLRKEGLILAHSPRLPPPQ